MLCQRFWCCCEKNVLQVLYLCIKGKYFSSREVSLNLLAARALIILTSLFGIEAKLCQMSRIEVFC